MKNIIRINLILLILGGVFFSSCNKDDEEEGLAKVLITFDPRYEGASIQLADRFSEVHSYPVEFTSMKFYLSHIQLLSGSETIDLSDIEIISVDDNRVVLEYEIPSGSYSGLKFDLGVPDNMNGIEESNPDFMMSLFDANHPLNESEGMYWSWNTGYRFFSFEGKCDTVDVGNEALTIPFAFHSGTDTLYRELPSFSHSFSVNANQTQVVPFEIDLGTLFASETDTIDLKNERAFHGMFNQLPVGIKFANNSAASIRLIE
jgi:hypothetical protein